MADFKVGDVVGVKATVFALEHGPLAVRIHSLGGPYEALADVTAMLWPAEPPAKAPCKHEFVYTALDDGRLRCWDCDAIRERADNGA
jgi:hypothetical protein